MLLSAFIRESTKALEAIYPSPEARGMVLMLCEEWLGVRSYTHIIEPSTGVPDDMLERMQAAVGRMAAGEPVQYVLGYCEFYGRRFNVAPGVLIPRPETEGLVCEALTAAMSMDRPARILDLCTGSGCIAWTLALELPSAEVTAVDISPEALEIARRQYPGHSPVFVQADVTDPDQDFGVGQVDLLLSNPPYIMNKEKAGMRCNVLDFEPHLALFVPDDDPLVFYRSIARIAASRLAPDGTGIVEINETLGEQTADVFKAAGFRNVSVLSDFCGKARFVKFRR